MGYCVLLYILYWHCNILRLTWNQNFGILWLVPVGTGRAMRRLSVCGVSGGRDRCGWLGRFAPDFHRTNPGDWVEWVGTANRQNLPFGLLRIFDRAKGFTLYSSRRLIGKFIDIYICLMYLSTWEGWKILSFELDLVRNVPILTLDRTSRRG